MIDQSSTRGRGGRRPGAGRPKGSKERHTLDKAAARELARIRITRRLEPLIDAQLDNALGAKILVLRNRVTGKIVRLTEDTARAALAADLEELEVYVREPSVPAAVALLAYALDRPAEQIRLAQDVSGVIEIVVSKPWASGQQPAPGLPPVRDAIEAAEAKPAKKNGHG